MGWPHHLVLQSCIKFYRISDLGFGQEIFLFPRSCFKVLIPMGKIKIASPQEEVAIDRAFLRRVAEAVLDGEGEAEADISLAFVDNATSQRLNLRYLEHDEPTDVLSFPLSDPAARKLSGELVIGALVARDQALARGHDLRAELALYVIHGLLHLTGYDDRTDAEAAKMRERERHYLSLLELPDIAPREEG